MHNSPNENWAVVAQSATGSYSPFTEFWEGYGYNGFIQGSSMGPYITQQEVICVSLCFMTGKHGQ